MLVAVLGNGAETIALLPWLALGGVLAVDLVLSARRHGQLNFDAPKEVFVGEDLKLVLTDQADRAGQIARFEWPDGLDGPGELPFQPRPGGGQK